MYLKELLTKIFSFGKKRQAFIEEFVNALSSASGCAVDIKCVELVDYLPSNEHTFGKFFVDKPDLVYGEYWFFQGGTVIMKL